MGSHHQPTSDYAELIQAFDVCNLTFMKPLSAMSGDAGDLVRIEGVRDSNPLSSTEKLQVRGSPIALILPAGWELSPYWEESGRSCPPGPGGDGPARLARLALSAAPFWRAWYYS